METKEKDKAINRYIKLLRQKQAFYSKWGYLKQWPKNGELDHAFRQCARFDCLKELKIKLNN